MVCQQKRKKLDLFYLNESVSALCVGTEWQARCITEVTQ